MKILSKQKENERKLKRINYKPLIYALKNSLDKFGLLIKAIRRNLILVHYPQFHRNKLLALNILRPLLSLPRLAILILCLEIHNNLRLVVIQHVPILPVGVLRV